MRTPPPPEMPTCVVAVGRRKEDDFVGSALGDALEERASRANVAVGAPVARGAAHQRLLLLEGLTPSAVLAVLGAVGSDADLVACVWFVPPSQPRLAAVIAMRRARTTRIGLHVALAPLDGSADAPAVLLSLHMTVLRARTPTQRHVLQALRANGTATDAAKALGCSRQAVSRAVIRANAHITAATILALRPLVAAIPGVMPNLPPFAPESPLPAIEGPPPRTEQPPPAR